MERFVYNLLKHNPKLKNLVRNIYQDLLHFFDFKNRTFVKGNMSSKDGYFFGFHDLSPFSKDESKILANKYNCSLKMPSFKDFIFVGYFDQDLNVFKSIDKTLAWNWHKGCRLQWVNENKLIFNSIAKDNTLISTIYDVNKNEKYKISYPIDTVSPNGNYATTFNYERLEILMPGYGYRQIYSKIKSFADISKASEKDGLFLIDLKEDKQQLLLSLKTLTKDVELLNLHHHFVTHTFFSPDSKSIYFLHRAVKQKDILKRFSRLGKFNIETKKVIFAKTSGMVSHYHVNSFDEVIVYCSVNRKDGHFLFDSNLVLKKHINYSKKIIGDGHQHFFTKNSQLFITDTYPDKFRYSSINLVDINNETSDVILNIKSPKKFRPISPYHHWSCDLHPRCSPSGKYICFDSVHTNKRSINLLREFY